MADDKRVAIRKLEELLMTMTSRRNDLAACRNKGDAVGVARYEGILKLDYALIRTHCAKHNLELPHDEPPEAHLAASDTE